MPIRLCLLYFLGPNVLCPCLFSKHIFRKLTYFYFIIFIFRLSIYSLTSEIPTNRAMLFLMIAFVVLPTISFKQVVLHILFGKNLHAHLLSRSCAMIRLTLLYMVFCSCTVCTMFIRVFRQGKEAGF